MAESIDLKTLQAEFSQWRQHKTSRSNRVPNDLRQKALALHGRLKPSKLVKALGVSSSTLKEWSGEKTPKKKSINHQPEFISLPATPVLPDTQQNTPPTHSSKRVHLSCESSNGQRWNLQGDIHPEQLSVFINTLASVQASSS